MLIKPFTHNAITFTDPIRHSLVFDGSKYVISFQQCCVNQALRLYITFSRKACEHTPFEDVCTVRICTEDLEEQINITVKSFRISKTKNRSIEWLRIFIKYLRVPVNRHTTLL